MGTTSYLIAVTQENHPKERDRISFRRLQLTILPPTAMHCSNVLPQSGLNGGSFSNRPLSLDWFHSLPQKKQPHPTCQPTVFSLDGTSYPDPSPNHTSTSTTTPFRNINTPGICFDNNYLYSVPRRQSSNILFILPHSNTQRLGSTKVWISPTTINPLFVGNDHQWDQTADSGPQPRRNDRHHLPVGP